MRTTLLVLSSLILLTLALVTHSLADGSGKSGPLRQVLSDDGVHDDWIYEDLDKGYALAKKTGKPLLVGFR